MLICNPQKGRLETIEVAINKVSTTWFYDCVKAEDIYMITDTGMGLLIREYSHSYPVLVYDLTRADIGYDQQKAREIIDEAIYNGPQNLNQ